MAAPTGPPLEGASSAGLYAVACAVAERLGVPTPASAAVGGASDGNITAGAGCPTLDGLGAVGGGAHADDEHVVIDQISPRTRLLAGIVAELVGAPRSE